MSHLDYIDNPEYMGTMVERVAMDIEGDIVSLSWTQNDYEADCIRYSIELAEQKLSDLLDNQ